MSTEAARRVVAEVTGELSGWSHRRELSGTRPDPTEELEQSELLIALALERLSRDRLAVGQEPLDPEEASAVAAEVRAVLFGFGPLDRLLLDPTIENVHANGCDRVFIARAGGERVTGPPLAASDVELVELIRRVAAQGGRTERRFDDAKPLLNLRLPDGSRLSAVMHVAGRPSLSIRRHRHTDVSLAELVGLGTLHEDLAAVMAAAVRRPHPLNLVVAGGTDAGKTTFLRALLAEIEPWERLVVIEDALELQLEQDSRRHPDVVELETREANVEGAGEITMRDLARHALRMAPDRVIVGEVRGGERLPLHPAVVLDADLVQHHLSMARRLPDAEAIVELRQALSFVRGAPYADRSYLWPDAEALPSTLTLLVTTVAAELGRRLLALEDVDGVFATTAVGLDVLPGHEELIALRLRAHALKGDRAALRNEYASYEQAVLADPWDGEPAPQLVALRRELLGPELPVPVAGD
jgi:Flp pilus assembly CpaF family ATPase